MLEGGTRIYPSWTGFLVGWVRFVPGTATLERGQRFKQRAIDTEILNRQRPRSISLITNSSKKSTGDFTVQEPITVFGETERTADMRAAGI